MVQKVHRRYRCSAGAVELLYATPLRRTLASGCKTLLQENPPILAGVASQRYDKWRTSDGVAEGC